MLGQENIKFLNFNFINNLLFSVEEFSCGMGIASR